MIFSTAIVQSAAVLLIVVWAAKKVSMRQYRVRRTALDIPFLAFMIARLVAIPLSIDPAVSLQALRTEIVFYPLFFVFTDTLDLQRPAEIRFLLQLIVWTAVVAALIGMAKYFLGRVDRATSTTAGYYTLGLYLCIALPLAVAAGRDLLRNIWLWALVCVLVMFGIVFTFDRLHWAAMILTVVAVGAVRERRLLAVCAVVGIAVVLLSPAVSGRLMQAINFATNSSGRDVLWRGAFMIAGEHPVFGFGLRTFPLIFPLRGELADQGIGSWHNDVLQIYMESGLVGLLSHVWLIAAVFVSAFRAYRSKSIEAGYLSIAGALLLSAFLLFLVGGILDTHVSLLFRFMLALLALLISAGRMPKAAGEIRTSGS